ncbi:hypothetical protein BOTBODRAFT_171079 [Botryobasidium botryosum FD-172 SS1]|uniref:Uncharacterized protein n=1 Tax=Botryobasidium botryosum (strain FD-172 SS1) TaxID=930990 RepID=A0A067MU39_BOTB1|nr:hypothetical protein BOTBODRAFT_171079 [Botryobasidium botryosum FD-172 SS1]
MSTSPIHSSHSQSDTPSSVMSSASASDESDIEQSTVEATMTSQPTSMATSIPRRSSSIPVVARSSPICEKGPRSRRPREQKFNVNSTLGTPRGHGSGERSAIPAKAPTPELTFGALVVDILLISLNHIKKPLAAFLAFLFIATSFQHCYVALLQSVVVPTCKLPLLSVALPFCPAVAKWDDDSRNALNALPDFREFLQLQTGLEGLLEASSAASLALELKKSELAIRDLITPVNLSDLKCKDTLVPELARFVVDAQDVGLSLQQLGAQVGGTVDSIIAMDRAALRTLEAASISGPLPRELENLPALAHTILRYVGVLPSLPNTRRALLDAFNTVADPMERQLYELIIYAEGTFNLLYRLDAATQTIHTIIAEEQRDVKIKRDDVLTGLWTTLGGNKREIAAFASHLSLLGQVSQYRMDAHLRVTATIFELRRLSNELAQLRDRVTNPLLGPDDKHGYAIEAQMESIRVGVKRLDEFRKRGAERERALSRSIMNLSKPMPSFHTE